MTQVMLSWRPSILSRRYWQLVEVESGLPIVGIDGYAREWHSAHDAATWAIAHGHTLDPMSKPALDVPEVVS